MYDFYYNVLKKRYDDKIKLLFTDTDSLCVEIETDDVYKDVEEQKQYYDFSEYPEDHVLHSTENQSVVGKFKDEMEGKIITEFVGLRSKLYSLTIQTNEFIISITKKQNTSTNFNIIIAHLKNAYCEKIELISVDDRKLIFKLKTSFTSKAHKTAKEFRLLRVGVANIIKKQELFINTS